MIEDTRGLTLGLNLMAAKRAPVLLALMFLSTLLSHVLGYGCQVLSLSLLKIINSCNFEGNLEHRVGCFTMAVKIVMAAGLVLVPILSADAVQLLGFGNEK